MRLFDDLPEIARAEASLSPLTWFKLGGPAEWLVTPRNLRELATVLRRCHETGTPMHVLGLGANVLVADEGVRGVVVRLAGELGTRNSELGNDTAPDCASPGYGDGMQSVVAGGGEDLTRLTVKTVKAGLAGLECLAGIPGTVGGGIRMNCGGRFGEIGQAVRRVKLMHPDGTVEVRDRSALQFGYRHSELGEGLVVEAEFELRRSDPAALQQRFREIWDYKQSSQPAMGEHSAGCIFRNPEGHAAGALIDRAGLKGFRIGSAYVASQHANFIMADGGGRSTDVLDVIEAVRERVFERFGIRLETEVQIWGQVGVCC